MLVAATQMKAQAEITQLYTGNSCNANITANETTICSGDSSINLSVNLSGTSGSSSNCFSPKVVGLSNTNFGMNATCSDNNGNLFVAGAYTGNTNFGNNTLAGIGGKDVFLVKYNSCGIQQWALRGGSIGNEDYAGIGTKSIATDASGNIFIVGRYNQTFTFYGINNTSFVAQYTSTSNGNHQDGYLIKINAIGEVIWGATLRGGSNDGFNGVAVDNVGNPIVTGGFNGCCPSTFAVTIYGPNGSLGVSSFGSNYGSGLVVKFDANGNILWKAAVYNRDTDLSRLAIDGTNNIYLVSAFRSWGSGTAAQFIDANGTNNSLYNPGIGLGFLVKLNSSGIWQWGTSYGNVGDGVGSLTNGTDVAIDENGNPWISGFYRGATATFYSTSGSTLSLPASTNDIGFIAKYSSSGVPQLVNSLQQSTGSTYFSSIAISNGTVGIAGYFTGNNLGSNDMLFVKYNTNAIFQSVNTGGGSGDDQANSVISNSTGFVVSGAIGGASSIDGVSLNTAGTFLWNNYISGVSSNSFLWSTGETTATINPTPTETTTYWCDITTNGETCRKEITIKVNEAQITASANTVSSGTAVALTLNNFNATSVIIDEFTMPFSGPFNRIVNTTIGQVYSMIVSGTWDSHCDYPGGKIDASFWGIHTSIQSPSDFIKWNGVFIRPTQDLYQPSHIYSYSNLISNSNTQTFAFTDNPYGDNCGALNFTVLLNQSNCIWSTGETTATINPTPTETTTYWCDVTTNGVTCRKEITITVNTSTSVPTASSQSFCNSSTVANLVAIGTDLKWYTAETGGTALASDVALASGTYYVSQTLNTIESDRTAVVVTVNEAQITASANTVSSGTAVNLAINNSPITISNEIGTISNSIGYGWTQNFSVIQGNVYKVTVNGAFSMGTVCPAYERDAAYWNLGYNNNEPVNDACNYGWFIQNYCNLRPYNDTYNPSHSYDYYITANSPTLTVGFYDCCYGDNCGNISFTISEINTHYLWSTGDTTATINPTPTATTTYWCDVTANGVTCRKELTITVRPLAPTATAQTLCGATTVANLVATGTDLKWYTAETGGTALASDVALVSGTYYVSQTLNNLESDRTAVVVTVNEAQITASANTVSVGTAVSLSLLENPITTNYSLDFPNSSQYSGSAEAVCNSNLSGFDLTGNFTIEFWIKAEQSYYWHLMGKNTFGDNSQGWLLKKPGNDLTIAWTYVPNEFSFHTFNYNVWEHVAISYDDESNTFYYFKNGNLISSENRNININPAPYNFVIGHELGTGNWFKGKIDNLRISNVVRYRENFNPSQNFNTDSNTIAMYDFNEGSGVVANDLSGNNRNLSLFNTNYSNDTFIGGSLTNSTYLWSTGETTATINPTPTVTTPYWCDVTANGVTCRKEITITVNSSTSAPTADAQIFCNGATVASLVATGTDLKWYDVPTTGTPLASTTPLTTGTYYVSQTLNNLESDRTAVQVTVNDALITASASTVSSGTAVELKINQQNVLSPNYSLFHQAGGYFADSNNDDYVVFPVSPTLNTNYPSWTMECWAKIMSPGEEGILSIGNPENGGGNIIGSGWSNTLAAGSNTDAGGGGTISSYNYPTAVWNHFALSYQNGTYRLFLNGILKESWVSGSTVAINNMYPLMTNTHWWWRGGDLSSHRMTVYYDDIRVSKVCRYTSDFIPNTNWNNDTNTIGLWNFNEGSGNTVLDYSDNLNNGIIHGATYSSDVPDTSVNNANLIYSYRWSTGETTASINTTPTETTTYWCDVTIDGVTCRKEITITVGSLGNEDNTIDLKIKVYPNPTSQLLYVSHPEQKNFSIRITDLSGKQMYSGTITTTIPLDMSKYPQGMYLVTVTNKETSQKNTYKILKK